MVRCFLPPFVLTCVVFASLALAQTQPPPGYLTADTRPQTERILPPPPPAGSGRQADDEAIFGKTRALKGSPRWALATADADLSSRAGLFACALGTPLDEANAPTLQRMFARMGRDDGAVVNPAKDQFGRPRPYVTAPGDQAICVPKTADLAKNVSYPSGHATLAWAWGLVLAEIGPDRATEILMRARAIGESRIVCGVHYLSDVEQGRTNGSILVAALHASPEFQADLAKAKREVAVARETPHAGPSDCLETDQAAQHPPY